jgi:hypothetical protein
MGYADLGLRGRWLHGLSTQIGASIQVRLIPSSRLNESRLERLFLVQ